MRRFSFGAEFFCSLDCGFFLIELIKGDALHRVIEDAPINDSTDVLGAFGARLSSFLFLLGRGLFFAFLFLSGFGFFGSRFLPAVCFAMTAA